MGMGGRAECCHFREVFYHICKDIIIQILIYISKGERELAICPYFNRIGENGFKLEPWKIWALKDNSSHIITALTMNIFFSLSRVYLL